MKFSCTYEPLSFCKFFLRILELIQSYEDKHHFRDQNSPFVMKKKIFGTNHYYYFHLPIGPFHCFGQKWSIYLNKFFFGKSLLAFSSTYQPLSLCKILKKVFQQIQSYEDVQFLDPKWSIFPNESFFRKPVHEPCFFIHGYLHANVFNLRTKFFPSMQFLQDVNEP